MRTLKSCSPEMDGYWKTGSEIDCFLPPGPPHAAHQGVANPDVVSIQDGLKDQLDLFGGQ